MKRESIIIVILATVYITNSSNASEYNTVMRVTSRVTLPPQTLSRDKLTDAEIQNFILNSLKKDLFNSSLKIKNTQQVRYITVNCVKEGTLYSSSGSLDTKNTVNTTCVACEGLSCIKYTKPPNTKEGKSMKPYIKEGYPKNVTMSANGNVTISCPAVSEDIPTLFWYGPIKPYGETNVGTLSGNSIESQNRNDERGTLTLYNITKKDEGWYVCVVSNNLGSSASKAFLTVLESETPSQSTSLVIILTVVFCGVLSVLVIVMATIYRKLKRENKQKQLDPEWGTEAIETYWRKKVTIEKPQMDKRPSAVRTLVMPIIKIENQRVSKVREHTDDPNMLLEYELPLDKDWEFPRDKVMLGTVLGEGEFGKVVKAECVDLLQPGLSTVAVKMLKDSHSDAEMMALISEMEVMKAVGKHENIINFLGCCTQNGPLLVIIEFAPYGSLKQFLRNHRPDNRKEYSNFTLDRNLTVLDLVSFAYQAAKGMEYLASRHCIHRDLAARNVLVSENYTMKIADFGLAKNIENEDYYRKKTSGKLPVRWMAPESLRSMLFNKETDVWSFGVLLWEIMTLGATPYRTVQGQYMYQHLRAGHRLEKTPSCRLDLYLLMRACWSFSPEGRPSFTEIVNDLERIVMELSHHE